MTPVPEILQILLACVTVSAGFTDWRSRTIPNWLVASGLILGIGANIYLLHWEGLARSAAGLGLAILVYLPLFALRAMGGGDVKLMAAAGAVVGARNWFALFLITSILGGLFAVALLLFRGKLRKTLRNVGFILTEMSHFRAPHASAPELDIGDPSAVTLPHGVVIAIGSILFLMLLDQ